MRPRLVALKAHVKLPSQIGLSEILCSKAVSWVGILNVTNSHVINADKISGQQQHDKLVANNHVINATKLAEEQPVLCLFPWNHAVRIRNLCSFWGKKFRTLLGKACYVIERKLNAIYTSEDFRNWFFLFMNYNRNLFQPSKSKLWFARKEKNQPFLMSWTGWAELSLFVYRICKSRSWHTFCYVLLICGWGTSFLLTFLQLQNLIIRASDNPS